MGQYFKMMRPLKQSERYVFEPFIWLFYCFFQPARFKSEFETKGLFRFKRLISMLKLAAPIVLFSCLIIFIIRILLGSYFPALSSLPLDTDTLLIFAVGVVGGLALGVVGNLILGIIGSLVLEIVIGLTIGTVTGQVRAEVFAITAGLLFGLVEGPGLSLTVFAAGGLTLGIVEGLEASIIGLIAAMTAGGIAQIFIRRSRKSMGIFVGGIVGFLLWFLLQTVTKGSTGDAASITTGIIFIISYTVGYYRILLYPVSSLSSLKAYLDSKKNPAEVFTSLQHSALYWDECVFLPLPKLRETLLLASEIDREQTLDLLALIINERPQQAVSAQAISLEILLRDLEQFEDLYDIAQASQLLDTFLPLEAKLLEPRYVLPLTYLNDASRDATSFFNLLGNRSRQEALAHMKTNLKKLDSGSMFRNTDFGRRLIKIVKNWLVVCETEIAHLEQEPEKSGSIHNPYVPGPVLKLGDQIFVGRQDLARQLEEALQKEIYRPTFFLFGERRMGKSSTLRHLPRLLGSHYIPVFYDLQAPGIAASVTTLLSTMASEIYEVISTRGIRIKRLQNQQLQEAGLENEAKIYYVFDEWLKELERTLEREDRTLLLTFDEFEQLEEAEEDNKLNIKLLLSWFRNIIQHRPRVALLFSGVRTIADMKPEWVGYFVNIQTLKVSFLSSENAYQLIRKPVSDFPGEQIFSEEITQEIVRVTGCHPFLLQALCSALIDQINTHYRDYVENQDIIESIEKVLERWGDSYFLDLWNRTDEAQQVCFMALIKLERGSLSQIEQQSGLLQRVAYSALARLVHRDLVVLEQDIYRIAVPIFSAWVEGKKDKEISFSEGRQ